MADHEALTEVEAKKAFGDMAKLVRIFYEELNEAGFSKWDALKLTSAYVTGLAQAKPD